MSGQLLGPTTILTENNTTSYTIGWSLPGHESAIVRGPLCAWTSDDENDNTDDGQNNDALAVQWSTDVDENHYLPAMGAPEALRLILVINPVSDEVWLIISQTDTS